MSAQTFIDLPVGAAFRFASDPRKERCTKVDGRSYENAKGERVWPGYSLGMAGFGPMEVRKVK